MHAIHSNIMHPQVLSVSANAVWVGEANWGFGPNLLPEDGWEVPYNGGKIRILVTKQPGQPRYIMLSKFIECKLHINKQTCTESLKT